MQDDQKFRDALNIAVKNAEKRLEELNWTERVKTDPSLKNTVMSHVVKKAHEILKEEAEIEKAISEALESPEARLLMQNVMLGAPVVYSIKDGKIEVPRYQIGGDDCEFCK